MKEAFPMKTQEKSHDHMLNMYKIKYGKKSNSELLKLIQEKTKDMNYLESELQALVELATV